MEGFSALLQFPCFSFLTSLAFKHPCGLSQHRGPDLLAASETLVCVVEIVWERQTKNQVENRIKDTTPRSRKYWLPVNTDLFTQMKRVKLDINYKESGHRLS